MTYSKSPNPIRLGLFLATVLVLVGCSQPEPTSNTNAENTEWFVVISNGMPQTVMNETAQQLQELIGRHAVPGDVVHVISTPSHQCLASLEVPQGQFNSRLKNQGVRGELGRLKPLFEAQPTSDPGQLQIPRLSSTVCSLRRTQFPSRVIVVGTPIYHDPRQRGWSMTGGMVPTDGALNAQHSPFNTPTRFPEGTKISWLTPQSEWGEDAAHQESVQRFNRLYLQERGAALSRMTAEPGTAFRFDVPQFSEKLVPREEEPGMRFVSVHSARPDEPPGRATVEIPVKTPEGAVVVTQVDNEVEELLADAEADTSTIALAINWESADPNCDLDLYVASAGSREEMCFRNKKTAFGELYRDVMRSGSLPGQGADFSNWEWAKVTHNRMEDLTVWINAYRTQKPATIRVIRVWNGRRKEHTLHLNASQGNGGTQNTSRSQSSAWIKVEL